jgi:hypothetical protein
VDLIDGILKHTVGMGGALVRAQVVQPRFRKKSPLTPLNQIPVKEHVTVSVWPLQRHREIKPRNQKANPALQRATA